MWTAACCTFSDKYNTVIGVTAFAAENRPVTPKVRYYVSPEAMFQDFPKRLSINLKYKIDLFPNNPEFMKWPPKKSQ